MKHLTNQTTVLLFTCKPYINQVWINNVSKWVLLIWTRCGELKQLNSDYKMTFFSSANIFLLCPNCFRLFMGGSADTPSHTDSCPSSLTQWWTCSWELVTTTLPSYRLSRIWWKASQLVYGGSWFFLYCHRHSADQFPASVFCRRSEGDPCSWPHRLPALTETLPATPHCDWRRWYHDAPLWPVAGGVSTTL